MSSENLKSEALENCTETNTSLSDHEDSMGIVTETAPVSSPEKTQQHINDPVPKISGLLGYEKRLTLEEIILEKMSVEKFISYFEQEKTDPVKAWNTFHFITQNLRHVRFNPHAFDNIVDAHKQNDRLVKSILVYHLKNDDFSDTDNIKAIQENKVFPLTFNDFPGLPCSDHHNCMWSNHSINPTYERIKKFVNHYLTEIKHVAHILCQGNVNPALDLKQALEETGVISVSWPISWGKNQEIENTVANALTGLNHMLCSFTGLSGPLLGISGKLCIHLGMESDDFGGFMYNRYSKGASNWYDIMVSGRYIDEKTIISALFHEWFHAFDSEFGQIISKLPTADFKRFLSNVHEKIKCCPQQHPQEFEIIKNTLSLQKNLFPKPPLDPHHSRVLCDDFIEAGFLLLETEEKNTFFYAPILKEIAIDSSYEKTNILIGKMLHISESHDEADSSFLFAFEAWVKAKHIEISIILKKRERPTRYHPSTILFRLFKSTVFHKELRHYYLFSFEELFARSFEQALGQKIGVKDELTIIFNPSLPGYDAEENLLLWEKLFKSLEPWWKSHTVKAAGYLKKKQP